MRERNGAPEGVILPTRPEGIDEPNRDERRLRAAFDNAGVGLTILRPGDGRYVRVNRRFCQLVGYEPSELLNMSPLDITHPDDVSRDADALAGLIRGDIESYSSEKRYLRRDGPAVWVSLHVSPVHDDQGRLEELLAVVVDISARKRAEEALALEKERLRLALQAAKAGVWEWDVREDRLTRSEEACQLYGIQSQERATIEEWLRSVHPDDREAAAQADREALARRAANYDIEYRAEHPRLGTRWFANLAKVIYDRAGEAVRVVGITQDVTDRKLMQEELLRLNAELEQLVQERTQALDDANRQMDAFTYSISHDLRAPLRAILSTSRILLDDLSQELGEQHLALLERQSANASRLSRLIDDLLRLSRLSRQPISVVEVDLSTLAMSVAQEVVAQQPGPELRFEIEPGIRAAGDPDLIRVALQELLANAVKFSPEGGLVEVGSLDVEGERVIFVRDQGIGFDSRYAHKLFLPFERLHGEGEFAGTGMGLTVVRRIVERHGGRTWGESAGLGRGATLFFTLPARRA